LSKLPANLRWQDLANILKKLGYTPTRQSSTHMLLTNKEGRTVTIITRNPIKRGTLEAILDRVGITREEFMKLL
jgi:predicted RNA binding protein YcfA (HicA-like mRNA interferase family)